MKLLFLSILFTCTLSAVSAQNFSKTQKSQEQAIQKAYKAKKITELEYGKLMREQEVIRVAIENAASDKVWTPKEKNAIHGKLERADRRLKRYRTNSEVY